MYIHCFSCPSFICLYFIGGGGGLSASVHRPISRAKSRTSRQKNRDETTDRRIQYFLSTVFDGQTNALSSLY